MECTKCHKEVREPLELYNGDIACPKCKSKLTQYNSAFSATNPRARELFQLSETYYNYSICKKTGIMTSALVDKSTLTAEEMVEKAIDLCQEAAKLGHPEALWRLAYFYDRDYLEQDKTKNMRCRIAANLYLSLITASETQFPGYGASGTSEETTNLKVRAANDLYALLKNISKYDRKPYIDALIDQGYLTQEALMQLSTESEIRSERELMDILKRTSSKRKAPVFGIIRVRKDQLERLADEIVKVPSVVNRKVNMMFIPLNKDDTYDFRYSVGGQSPYHVVRVSADAIRTGIKMAVDKADENCCVYFFNKGGKHKYYSPSQCDKLCNSINDDLIDRLISTTPGRSYTFYDDDIYFKGGKADRIIAEIAANVEA